MSKSYRIQPDYEKRALLRPVKSRSRKSWKKESEMLIKEKPFFAYIIINEWPLSWDAEIQEIVSNRWFDTGAEAWNALRIIAESFDIELQTDHTGFSVPSRGEAPGQTYYIQELTQQ